jgi:hypothetical protein
MRLFQPPHRCDFNSFRTLSFPTPVSRQATTEPGIRCRTVITFFCLVLIFSCLASEAYGQVNAVVTDQAPPIPGAGHDYIHFLNETVSPSSGSVSIRSMSHSPQALPQRYRLVIRMTRMRQITS